MKTGNVTEQELLTYYRMKWALAILKRESDRGQEFHHAIDLLEKVYQGLKDSDMSHSGKNE